MPTGFITGKINSNHVLSALTIAFLAWAASEMLAFREARVDMRGMRTDVKRVSKEVESLREQQTKLALAIGRALGRLEQNAPAYAVEPQGNGQR
jgi:hypothetical protein